MADDLVASVCDDVGVINDDALLGLAEPSTLRSLPRLDEVSRARLLSACTHLLFNAVRLQGDLEGDGDGVLTGTPIIVAILKVLRHSNIVYGERNHVVSELQSEGATTRLVKLLDHVDTSVVLSAARVLSDLACTGGDAEIDAALMRLRNAGCATAARAACVRIAIESNEAGLHLCDLLCALYSNDEQLCDAALTDDAFTRCVVDTLLQCDSVMWFEDAAPAVQLAATLVHFGNKALARSFIESRDFALLSALAGSLTCDDRGEGVVGGWLLCVGAVLEKGVDGGVDAEEEEQDDDDDDDSNDVVPVESAYVDACTRLGVQAMLEGVEAFEQGGRRLLSKYFAAV